MTREIKILFIDDDEEDFIIVEDLLNEIQSRNYKLDWISNFKDAETALSKNNFQVVLLDYRLGAQSGLDLLKKFNPLNLSGPVILLTGQEDSELDYLATKTGFADYLIKSKLEPELLDRSIRYNIEQFRNLQKIKELNKNLEQKVEERTQKLNKAIEELEENNNSLRVEIKRRKETEAALYSSQQMYNAITSNFPNGSINIFDKNYTYLFSDGRELKELGVSNKLLNGVSLLDNLPKEDANIFKTNLDKVFEGNYVNFEVLLGDRYFKIHGVPLDNPAKEIDQIMVVGQNITEQKLSEQNIKKSLEKERELNELKTRFVSMASHEFRTPLAAILSSTSLINKYREKGQLDGQERHIKKIINNIKHLTQILNDFLALGRLEEGKVSYNPEYFNVVELVEDTIDDLREIVKNGQSIEVETNASKLILNLDPQVLRNILFNLISNASKYSREEGKIIVTLNETQNHLNISVQDFGLGIPKGEQKLLFERFFRASNVSNIQGTGLGLNIVKKYVDLMEGTITFTSRFNEGTTFNVNIPKT
jgi:signal transduction histidine kinase/DNA-binding response OmpR family regulator